MSWFFFSVICILGWGCADLFYKMGTDEDDSQSHLKIAVWVGLVMGAVSLCLLPLSETGMSPSSLAGNIVRYSPASLGYIISMVVGYAGMRYLEVSIISPIQNASGALSAVCMFVWFLVTARIGSFTEEFTALDIIGTVIIVIGVIGLAVVEQRLASNEVPYTQEQKKYRFGALALIFPVLYCVFDTIGTTADGIILSDDAGTGLGEIDVIILYGLTFLLAGAVCWVYMLLRNKTAYNPFRKHELKKGAAAVCEQFGQIFYVYAMAERPVLAAPMIASYCIVSVILSRIVIREKLKPSQYVCVFAVILGIVCLGIAEGLAS